jgi:osmotically-inducible protein OsmY
MLVRSEVIYLRGKQEKSEPIMNDLQLRRDILDELEFEPRVNAVSIGVAVERGAVTLTGHASTYPEKLAAVKAVRRVKSVRAIADEIEVRFLGDRKAIPDDEIARCAMDIVGWDTLLPSGAIQIIVRDGWITLTGNVEWYYQLKAAEEDVRKLLGVRGVTNNMAIVPRVQAQDMKRKTEDALKRHDQTRAKGISVTVRDGDKVVLEGKIQNWDEWSAVENAAWSVPGVKRVEDRLAMA